MSNTNTFLTFSNKNISNTSRIMSSLSVLDPVKDPKSLFFQSLLNQLNNYSQDSRGFHSYSRGLVKSTAFNSANQNFADTENQFDKVKNSQSEEIEPHRVIQIESSQNSELPKNDVNSIKRSLLSTVRQFSANERKPFVNEDTLIPKKVWIRNTYDTKNKISSHGSSNSHPGVNNSDNNRALGGNKTTKNRSMYNRLFQFDFNSFLPLGEPVKATLSSMLPLGPTEKALFFYWMLPFAGLVSSFSPPTGHTPYGPNASRQIPARLWDSVESTKLLSDDFNSHLKVKNSNHISLVCSAPKCVTEESINAPTGVKPFNKNLKANTTKHIVNIYSEKNLHQRELISFWSNVPLLQKTNFVQKRNNQSHPNQRFGSDSNFITMDSTLQGIPLWDKGANAINASKILPLMDHTFEVNSSTPIQIKQGSLVPQVTQQLNKVNWVRTASGRQAVDAALRHKAPRSEVKDSGRVGYPATLGLGKIVAHKSSKLSFMWEGVTESLPHLESDWGGLALRTNKNVGKKRAFAPLTISSEIEKKGSRQDYPLLIAIESSIRNPQALGTQRHNSPHALFGRRGPENWKKGIAAKSQTAKKGFETSRKAPTPPWDSRQLPNSKTESFFLNSDAQNGNLKSNHVSNVSYEKALMLIENNLKSVGLGLNFTENELMSLSLIKQVYKLPFPQTPEVSFFAKKKQFSQGRFARDSEDLGSREARVTSFTKNSSNITPGLRGVPGEAATKRAFVWFNFNNNKCNFNKTGDLDYALLKTAGTLFSHPGQAKTPQAFSFPLSSFFASEEGRTNTPSSEAGTDAVTFLLQTLPNGPVRARFGPGERPQKLSNKLFLLQNLITEPNQKTTVLQLGQTDPLLQHLRTSYSPSFSEGGEWVMPFKESRKDVSDIKNKVIEVHLQKDKRNFKKDLTIAEFKHPWLNTTTRRTENKAHPVFTGNLFEKYHGSWNKTRSVISTDVGTDVTTPSTPQSGVIGVAGSKLSTEVSWKSTNVSPPALVFALKRFPPKSLKRESTFTNTASSQPQSTLGGFNSPANAGLQRPQNEGDRGQKGYILLQRGVTNNLRNFLKWVVYKSGFMLKSNIGFDQKQCFYPRSFKSLEKILRAKLSETSNDILNKPIKKVYPDQGKRHKIAVKLKSLWSLKKMYKTKSGAQTPSGTTDKSVEIAGPRFSVDPKGVRSFQREAWESGGYANPATQFPREAFYREATKAMGLDRLHTEAFKANALRSTQYLKAKKFVSTMLAKDFSKYRFYSGKISSKQSFFYIQNLLKQKIKRQKKRYLKKYKQKSRRTSYKRRSRAYPRPSWIRLKLYQRHFKLRWVNSRYIHTARSVWSPAPRVSSDYRKNLSINLKQGTIWDFNRERQIFSNKKRKPFTLTPTGTGTILNAPNFYTISQTTKSYLRKAEAESDWFRLHLKSYLARIQKYLNNARETESDWQWFGFINSLISQNNVASSSRFTPSLFLPQKEWDESFSISPMASHAPHAFGLAKHDIIANNLEDCWQESLAISQYNRILYNRIQTMVLNIKQNLNSEGNIGVVPPSARLKIKSLKKQILTDIFPSSKAIKKNKTQDQLQFSGWFFNNFRLKPYSFWLNPISQLRPYWAYNKTNAAYFQQSHGAKMSKIHRLWSNQKLRAQALDNKTKMFQKKILARWDAFFSGDLDLAKFCLHVASHAENQTPEWDEKANAFVVANEENPYWGSQGDSQLEGLRTTQQTVKTSVAGYPTRDLQGLARKSWDFRISQKLRQKEEKLSLLTRFRLPEGMRNIISKRYSISPISSEANPTSEGSYLGIYGIHDRTYPLQEKGDRAKNVAIGSLNGRLSNFENLHTSNSAQIGWWSILESFKNPFSLSTQQLPLGTKPVRNHINELKSQAVLGYKQHQVLNLLRDDSHVATNFRFFSYSFGNHHVSPSHITQQITVFLLSGCTILFHFCTLISLINIPQVRCFLKFNLILIFKFGPTSVQIVHSILNHFKQSYSKFSNSLAQVQKTLFLPFTIRQLKKPSGTDSRVWLENQSPTFEMRFYSSDKDRFHISKDSSSQSKSTLSLIDNSSIMSLETKINSHAARTTRKKQIEAFKNFAINSSFMGYSIAKANAIFPWYATSRRKLGLTLGANHLSKNPKTKLSSTKLSLLKPFLKMNLISKQYEMIFKKFNFILGYMWFKMLNLSLASPKGQQAHIITPGLKDGQIKNVGVKRIDAADKLPSTNQQGLSRQGVINNIFDLFSTINTLVLNFFRSTGKNLADQAESGFSGTDESVLVYDLLYDLLMVCWFSDPLLLIPEQVEVQTWNHTLKLSRSTGVWPLPIKVNILFDILIESLTQPDTDLIIRQQKGTVFFEIWGDFLIKAAEEYKMHIPSISQYPDEQALLVDKFLSTGLSMTQKGSIKTHFHYEAKQNKNLVATRETLNTPQVLSSTRLVPSDTSQGEINALLGFAQTPKYAWNNKLLLSPVEAISYCYESLFHPWAKQDSCSSPGPLWAPRDATKSSPYGTIWKNQTPQQLTSQAKVSSWAVDQFLTYQSQDTNMLIDVHPPKSFAHVGAFKHYSKNHQCIGNLVCEIYSGTFAKKVSKNVLVVGHRNSPNFLIQALAGETELKIITDNSRAYATQQGIKQLKNVFEAIGVHAPCIFLLEDIHLIGERRPFAMSDEENSGDFDELVSSGGVLNSPLRMHEKNQVFYEVFRHSITHYQKPFRGDSSLLIPTNHFSVDLFLGVSPPRSRQGIKWENALIPPVNLEDFGLSQTGKHPFRDGDQTDPSHAFGGQRAHKFVRLSSSLQVPSDQFFAPPSTSPLSVLVLKEQYKLKPRKIVNDSPFADRETVQLTAKINYSIRFKVTRLAELAASKRVGKFEMVTDLLMILDTVRSQRGFIVFATTNAPSILDPAIRRPGRLDETIYLPTIPNLWSRWQILKSSLSYFANPTIGSFFGFPLGLTMDYLANSKIPLMFPSPIPKASHAFGGRIYAEHESTQRDLTTVQSGALPHPFKHPETFDLESMPKITSKNAINIKAITYYNVSKKLISTNYAYNPTSYDGILWTGVTSQAGLGPNGRTGNSSSFSDSVQNLLSLTSVEDDNLREQEIFLSFYSPQKILKQQLIQLFAGKVGESLAFSASHSVRPSLHVNRTGYKKEVQAPIELSTEPAPSNLSGSIKNSRNFTPLSDLSRGVHYAGSSTDGKSQAFYNGVMDAPQLLSTYGIDTSWRSATSLVFALIQKRYLHTKNKILVKLLNFIDGSNSASPSELPSHDRLFAIFAPAKRYENYKRTERDFQVKQSYQILEKIQMHQQHRLTRRLYDLPVQKFFRSEMIENSLTTFSNVSRVLGPLQKASVLLEGLKGSPHKTTSINWYYKKRVLMRHRHYLTNQWLNAQYPEHNVETVFLSDIDWRYNFIESLETGSITDILLDFPDTDQYYNPKHRRWMCTSGSWTYNLPSAFASEQVLDQQIYAHFIFDSFLKAYNLIDKNREILDYLAFKFMKLGYLKEINLVKSKSKFSVL